VQEAASKGILSLGIDPGTVTGLAVLTGLTPRLVAWNVARLPDMKKAWLPNASVLVYRLIIPTMEAVRAEYGTDPMLTMEYPIQGPDAAGYGAQMAFCGAVEGLLLARGYPVDLRGHPLTSKKALTGIGAAPRRLEKGKRLTEKEKKEPMVKMCRLRNLWPDAHFEPARQDERWALADAISHALVLLNLCPRGANAEPRQVVLKEGVNQG